MGIEFWTQKAYDELKASLADDFPKVSMLQCEHAKGHNNWLQVVLELTNWNEDTIKVLVSCVVYKNKPIKINYSRVIK